ncbi:glycosyltransferase family 2 protein, partial [Vibrio lentus]
NNIIYSYCEDALEMNREDIFIVFNPDIVANIDDIELLIKYMNQESHPIAAVNLFRDKELSISDNSVRNFPNLIQFSKSFLGLGNTTIINKNQTHKPTKVDWAAGSFLAFKAYHYKSLKGFDEKYFMYCEDIDICYRSNLIGYPVTFFPDIKIQHLAEHANRSILSKHFYWHVKSVFRFLLTRKNLTKSKSSL